MTDPYLFERGIGQQMGDLCRLAVGNAKVTQTGEIVTLEDMLGRGAFGVSVEVPYTSGGVQSVSVTRCGKNLLAPLLDNWKPYLKENDYKQYRFKYPANLRVTMAVNAYTIKNLISMLNATHPVNANVGTGIILENSNWGNNKTVKLDRDGYLYVGTPYAVAHLQLVMNRNNIQVELGTTPTAYEPYNGDTYTIALPADFHGGSINLEAGTVTNRYAADGTELAEPVVTEIDPISIPILAGVNNVWADVGTVTVSYYAADAQTFRPALWYPTIYRGLTSARYLIKRASGAIASFDDAIAAPLVVLRVALPYDAEGYQSVSVTRCGKNLLGGETLVRAIVANGATVTVDTTNKTVYWTVGNHKGSMWSHFKNETYYTFIFKLAALSGYVNLRFHNLNGDRDSISNWSVANRPVGYSAAINSPWNNVSSFSTWNINGSTTLYYDACGLFEGDITVDDFEPYNGDTYTIALPTTIYGGYLDVVTGQLVATHDENGNLLTNQKLYFLPPTNINALAGVNNVWSDAGDVAVSYRIDNG